MRRSSLFAALFLSTLLSPLGSSVRAAEVIKLGLSGPMSGAGANWGLLAEWAAKQAADQINREGGVTVGGVTYTFQAVAYDNKYTASEGAKVGQALINRDGVRFIVFGLGMAPVRALQSLSEKAGAVLFTTGAGKSIKGPQFPFTFTELNTPFERYLPLFQFVTKTHPTAKTVVVVDPNDDTGTDAAAVSRRDWVRAGIQILDTNFYERGTTEFAPLITKIAARNPDMVDFSEMPPSDTGLILAGLREQGWNGVVVWSAGTSAADLIQAAGPAADGVYMALAGDFSGASATAVQRRLDEGAVKALGQHMNAISLSAWDATMAIRAAMLKSGSVEPDKVRQALPGLVFESSYGPSGFGGDAEYGSPQQMLLPIIITQVEGGKVMERARILPSELQSRVAAPAKP